MSRKKDGGYAMLAAVAGITVFGYMGIEAVTASRANVSNAIARIEQAQLAAAADAAVAVAIAHLGGDAAGRWPVNGTPQMLRFNGVDLVVRIEDENAKVPLNQLNDTQLRRLFAAAGANGDRLDVLVDSFKDWKDEDDVPEPHGAESAYYAPAGLQPRNGDVRTLEELSRMRGMNAALLGNLAPLVTLYYSRSAPFDAANASPLAAAIMTSTEDESSEDLTSESRLYAEHPALSADVVQNVAARSLTIAIEARNQSGGFFARKAVVQMTGLPTNPYWIRFMQ